MSMSPSSSEFTVAPVVVGVIAAVFAILCLVWLWLHASSSKKNSRKANANNTNNRAASSAERSSKQSNNNRRIAEFDKQGEAKQRARSTARKTARVRRLTPGCPVMSGRTNVNPGQQPYAHLQTRLKGFGLIAVETDSDGNCQFHALLDQLRRFDVVNPGLTQYELRQQAVKWLRDNADVSPFGDNGPGERQTMKFEMIHQDDKWNAYLEKMAKDQTWGDERTLVAIVIIYNVVLFVISSTSPRHDRTYYPPGNTNDYKAYLSVGHIVERHYVSTKLASDP